MFLLGYILQRILINRVIDRPHLISLLVTFSLSIIMANAAKLIWTATPRTVNTALSGFWRVGNVTIPITKTYVLLAAMIIMVLLHLFLQHTRLGKSIRAAAQNREAARIVGIEIGAVYAITFAICIALTGSRRYAHQPDTTHLSIHGAAADPQGFRHHSHVRSGQYPRRADGRNGARSHRGSHCHLCPGMWALIWVSSPRLSSWSWCW